MSNRGHAPETDLEQGVLFKQTGLPSWGEENAGMPGVQGTNVG